eukprot:TRINITY_DN9144_c0_g2_i1.p1 TRINITY_DN9144_c0_g2~~TRINITY_DN9144_c0_g2_i1.p1  ORF type:complete len:486 (+),score=75.37 TRINITY_DN9144_c0_g2_i1:42-1499(+)
MRSQTEHHVFVPSPPVWIQASVIAAVLATWYITYTLGELMFPGDEPKNYILAAIPTYFILIIVEWTLQQTLKRNSQPSSYDLVDSWSSMAAGLVQQLVFKVFRSITTKLLLPYFSYSILSRAVETPVFSEDSRLTFPFALILADFVYYWMHRFGHTNALLWAGHQHHHTSEHYNFSTALRQGWFQGLYSVMGELPAAILIPPRTYVAAKSINTVYQFWVHTCLVRRLGWLEYVLSTPSHHRVHHDRRFHKNFGGMFIVFDRLFGTFLDEEDVKLTDDNRDNDDQLAHIDSKDRPREIQLFGVMRTERSWAEPAVQLQGFTSLWHRLRKGTSGLEVLKGPGYHTATRARELKYPTAFRFRIGAQLSLLGIIHLVAHFIIVLVVGVAVLVNRSLPNDQVVGLVAWLVASLYVQGVLCDGHINSSSMELVRSGLTMMALASGVADHSALADACGQAWPMLRNATMLACTYSAVIAAARPSLLRGQSVV